jgi:hypothetical protein
MTARQRKVVESHGCIVCGRLHELLVVYAREGRMIDCGVISPGGRRVYDADRPLAACEAHPDSLIEAARARRAAASRSEDDEDE